jgi:serine/threonine-protein kinase RsbW
MPCLPSSDGAEVPNGIGRYVSNAHARPFAPDIDGCAYVELEQFLPSELTAISPFADQLMLFIHKFREADGSEVDIEIALREALANAVVHGNHADPNRRVHVTCCCSTEGEVSITVSDDGRGFDNRAVPDPTAPANVEFTCGRGLYLMQMLMDEVLFERSGTVVHRRKKSAKVSPAREKRCDEETLASLAH